MEDILPDFVTCFKFIDKAREGNGAVLVHCSDGVSRSGAISIAYVMQKQKMTLKVQYLISRVAVVSCHCKTIHIHTFQQQDAFDFVVAKRSCVQPNCGLWEQLQTFEKTLQDE